MNKKYVLSFGTIGKKQKKYLASQAVDDVAKIAENLGYKKVLRYQSKIKGVSSFLDVFLMLKIIFVVPRKSVILYQHPMYFSNKIFGLILRALKIKEIKTVVLIHDLNMCRNYSVNREKQELQLLVFAQVIVSHNLKMTSVLVNKGIQKKKIIELGIFDYLVSNQKQIARREDPIRENSVVIAGNLERCKCGYLYKLIEKDNIYIDVYGVNFAYADERKKYKKAKYHGFFPADELPDIITGGFGLVWDGDSTDSCEGNYGEYLRINNPHKFSLYIASGIPVIVWNQSALSCFVEQNEIGIVSGSINEANEKIQKMTRTQYQVYKKNVQKLQEKVRSGFFTESALNKAWKMLEDMKWVEKL